LQRYSAGAGMTSEILPLREIGVLGMKAVKVDIIKDSIPLFDEDKNMHTKLPASLKFMCGLETTYVTGESRLEVCWRTLVNNTVDLKYPCREDNFIKFCHWITFLIERLARSRSLSDSPLEKYME